MRRSGRNIGERYKSVSNIDKSPQINIMPNKKQGASTRANIRGSSDISSLIRSEILFAISSRVIIFLVGSFKDITAFPSLV